MRSVIVRSFQWLPVLAPPCRARGAVHVGGGVRGAPCGASGGNACSVILSGQKGRQWPVGLLQRWLGSSAGEVRANLATPLWTRPLSVTDALAAPCPPGRRRQRHALSLPATAVVTGLTLRVARGGRATPVCNALATRVQRPAGGIPSRTRPLWSAVAVSPTGVHGTPAPTRMQA